MSMNHTTLLVLANTYLLGVRVVLLELSHGGRQTIGDLVLELENE